MNNQPGVHLSYAANLSRVWGPPLLSAVVESDGTVTLDSEKYPSLSAAGGAARRPLFKGHLKGRFPATNGWTFWQVKDPLTNQLITLDILRDRFLQKKKEEARRFGKVSS